MGSIPETCGVGDRVLCGLRNSMVIVLGATFINSQIAQWIRFRLGMEPLPLPLSLLEGWLLCWMPAFLLAPFCILRKKA